MPTPELYRNGAFSADDWVFPAAGEPVPADGKVALPKARFLAERAGLAARNGAIGIVNVNSLDIRDTFDAAPPLHHYDGEDETRRRSRRRKFWMPATVIA
jgi:hypothetical protein